MARVGTVSRLLLPTDGLWRAAMRGFQDPTALVAFGGEDAAAFPFLSRSPITSGYALWTLGWLVLVGLVTMRVFERRDL
ncbi:MAG: hypothetical protein R2749_30080 [Acidimicrobiales bacterium]